jgi:acylphosphatase
MDRVRARVIVAGRVQGVFFRDSTRRRAQELGLGGWVRNLPDLRVEAVFEGERAHVEAAVAFVREGPRLARVTDVEVSWERPRGEPAAFEIRY